MSLKWELTDLAVAIRTDDEDATGYFVAKDHDFIDFNKEIVEPGENANYPHGALSINADDDFYSVAVIPYKFEEMSCADIVAILWPDIENPVIRPDHGDYWWTAQRDSSLEVPGEPWELWFVETAPKKISNKIAMQVPHFTPETGEDGYPVGYDAIRWRTCNTMEEAVEARSSIGGTVYKEDFENIGFEIRHWHDGVRTTVRTLDVNPEKFQIVDRPKEPNIYNRLGLDVAEAKEGVW